MGSGGREAGRVRYLETLPSLDDQCWEMLPASDRFPGRILRLIRQDHRLEVLVG